MTAGSTRMLRSDARENRDRLLDAARTLFAERGLAVSMRDVARAAGVGPATLYRRFPTRQHLVDAVFAEELRTCSTVVSDGCADPDPWRGFCAVVTEIHELNARNQGFVDAIVASGPADPALTTHREQMVRSLADLGRRAIAAGALRPDFVVDDLVLAIMAVRGLSSLPTDLRVDAARRLAALTIDAFRAPGSSAAPRRMPPPARVTARAVVAG